MAQAKLKLAVLFALMFSVFCAAGQRDKSSHK
jgi:hypothetical protein